MTVNVFYNSKERKCEVVAGEKVSLFESVLIDDPTFVVDKHLWKKATCTGERNKHASVQGLFIKYDLSATCKTLKGWQEVYYNRFAGEFRKKVTDEVIDSANTAIIIRDRIFIS